MNSNKTTLAAALLSIALLASAIGAGAYTMFTAERGTNIDVVSDDKGIILLGPGNSSFVYQDGNGELTVDVTRGGASGVNVNSTLLIGNKSNPLNEYAFNVTNNDQKNRSVTLNYSMQTNPDSTKGEVKYIIYDDSGTQVATASEEADGTVTVPAQTTYYVVMEIDTLSASTSDDFSGTLKVTAE